MKIIHYAVVDKAVSNVRGELYSCFIQCSSVAQSFEIPWTAAHQASLSISNSWSLLKLMSIELVMPSNHLMSFPSPPALNLS